MFSISGVIVTYISPMLHMNYSKIQYKTVENEHEKFALEITLLRVKITKNPLEQQQI